VVQDIQPNTTTVQNTKTVHVQVTVVPEAKSASSASPVEVTSHSTPAPASQKPNLQASSSHLAPAPVKSESPHPTSSENHATSTPESSGSANSPIYAAPAPAPVKFEAPQPAVPDYHAASYPKSSELAISPIYAAPAPAPKPEAPALQAPAQAPTAKPKASSSPHQYASAPITTGGSQWCITYSPYTPLAASRLSPRTSLPSPPKASPPSDYTAPTAPVCRKLAPPPHPTA